MTVALIGAMAIGFAASIFICTVIARNAGRLGLVDVPNTRSSHERPTPRGGGIGVVIGVLAGTAALAAVGFSRDVGIVIAGFVVIAGLGLLDDLRSIPAAYRLILQAVVAGVVVALVGGINRVPLPAPLDLPLGLLASPVAVVWLVTVTNFYNFMDGVNGLAGGQAVASCIGIVVAGFTVATTNAAVVLTGAVLGFLVLNFPVARIFLGDVGSTSIGFLLAGLPMAVAPSARPAAVFAVGVGLAIFLLDPSETLVRLVRSGHRLGLAHREHTYQHLGNTADRRPAVAIGLVITGMVLALGGALAFRAPAFAWPVLVLALVTFVAEKLLDRRRSAASALETQRG